jgi:Ca2+-transporting ATPase
MGPTCSIIYENEPIEKNAMFQNPKALTTTFFNWKELFISIIQGLVIACGTLFIYQYAISVGYDEALTRTMVFTVLITANIFLTLVNRSFYYSIFTTLRYKNNMVLLIIFITIAILGLILFIKPLTNFFEFETLNWLQLSICIIIGFFSVIWFEVVKYLRRKRAKIVIANI